jgi:L-seryl-tRNA(Ser) seleniumtransferase
VNVADAALRSLPKVDLLARDPALVDLPHGVAVGAARQVLGEVRAEILAGARGEVPADLAARVAARARLLAHGRLVPVINATGVVVHTNLGRAPWSPSARAAALRAAGYCDLELELASGTRGGRLSGVSAQARHLFGAESALVVNNNAAAVLLALTALAAGREVVVSRGQLVEIGGSFRVPDVIAAGGARLREVGTTNRTRAADYAAAIGPDTAVLLLVHPSNFRTVGFTESPHREELAALGRAHGVPVVEDLGAGAVEAAQGEPSVREVVASGVDLVCCSGDKLLGGPQAGLVLGGAAWVERLRRHPMYRALRVDKVTLAALEATLGDHAAGRPPPVIEMLTAPLATVRARAERLASMLLAAGCAPEVVEVASVAGGGALPESPLPSAAVRLPVPRPDAVARALRTGEPAVMARIEDGALVLDLRTVADDQSEVLARRVASAIHPQ